MNDASNENPFQVIINSDGIEQLISPLASVFKDPKLKFVYTGSSNIVRGIPVNEWVTCYYGLNRDYVQRITISFSGNI